jgi:uncharacterized protein (TIGR02118 family)
MVKISILYPDGPGATFDMNYYVETHMPMSIGYLSAHAGFRSVSVERGLAGPEPGSSPPFRALCHYVFESLDDFVAAFMPHAPVLQADMHNYTDIVPVIQVSQIEISQSQSASEAR